MNYGNQEPQEPENDVLYLDEDDYVMLVTPYSPEIAEKIKKASLAFDFNTRQMLAEAAAIKDPGWKLYGATLEALVEKHQLDESFTGSGHSRLVGPKDRVTAAFEEIQPHYNSRLFSAHEYVAFEEKLAEAREASANGQNGGSYDASRN